MRLITDGFKLHINSIKLGFKPPLIKLNQLIHFYSKNGLINYAQKLFDEMTERNIFSWNTIIFANIETKNIKKAEILFEQAPEKDNVTYNSMLCGFVKTDGYELRAVELFKKMHWECDFRVNIDDFSCTTMLNLVAKMCCSFFGKQLHCFMAKSGNDLNKFAISALIDMYSKCGLFKESCQVFKNDTFLLNDLATKNAMIASCCRVGEMETAKDLFWNQPELNDVITWNTLISGYASNGLEEEAFKLFSCMREYGFRWNEHTFGGVLSACSSFKNLRFGKEVHAWTVKHEMSSNSFISSLLVDVYCKCGNLKYAELVYKLFGLENPFSISSMIVGYSSLGKMVEARKLFDSFSDKNYVVWTALFSGYVRSKQFDAVFELLNEFMNRNGTFLDGLIFISVLNACAVQAAVNPGKQIHAYILRRGIKMDEMLLSAIVDMYSKCGDIVYASELFKSNNLRDLVLYNVMIAGFAHHGHEKEAIQLFEDMLGKGTKPDEVTFLALLSACRHSGSVELGEKYFNLMIEKYGIEPKTDHYACMIDLYGRANLLEKVVAFTRKIHVKKDAVILGTFLNACKLNKNAAYAKEAEEELLKIEGYNGGRYVLLANTYASEGNWDEMGRIRKQMREKKVKKLVGCSWVHVENKAHIFTSNDTSHSETNGIYSILQLVGLYLNDIVGMRVKLDKSVCRRIEC